MTVQATGKIQIITGPFHPCLEHSLQARLEGLMAPKARQGGLPSLALVTPSTEMRRYLKHLMTLRWNRTFVGVHLLTAFHMGNRIAQSSNAGRLRRTSDLILAELVRGLVLSGDFPPAWKELVQTVGGADALTRTLRDLEEARVRADEKEADPVLRLHALYQARRRELGLGTMSDPVEAAIEGARDSGFLKSLDHVLYYGFYDMTQLQIDLLARVSSFCPTTVFLPCAPGRRAYEFPNGFLEELKTRFPDAEIQSAEAAKSADLPLLQPALEALFDESTGRPEPEVDAGGFRSFTASGPEAELEIAAKEILRWVEEENVDFQNIGVVARNLSAYLPHLGAVFNAHAIPFRTTEKQPITRFPWAKALLALNRALAEDFPAADVLELLVSPFLRAGDGTSIGETARDLVRRRDAVRGLRDWEKLAGRPDEEFQPEAGEEGLSSLSAEQVKAFRERLSALLAAAKAFPVRGTWEERIREYRGLVGNVFDLSASPEGDGDSTAKENSHTPCGHLEAVLMALGDHEKLHENVDRNAFLSVLSDHLHGHEVSVHDPAYPAVEVLNAMDARAKRFEALVVMGLQEGVWPWRAPEDPFLTDRTRQRIADEQNVRLLKKSATHEEERLLFTLVLTSAHRFVTLTWQRSAEDGKPLVRSWFVHETARAMGRIGGELAGTLPVPRRLEDRFRGKSFPEPLYTPSEWAAWQLLHDQSPVDISHILGFGARRLERCFDAGQRLKHLGSHLTDRDGITGKIPELWKEFQAKGWSPTSLETYARCPFQFFANRVLGLEELEDLQEVPEIGGLEIGNLLHEVFQRFFSKWKQGNGSPPFELLSKVIEDALARFEAMNPLGYPLLWRMTRAFVKAMAEEYVAEQTVLLMESGFRPFAFELKADAVLPSLPADRPILRGLKIAGRLDRIDRRETQSGSEVRVVDYKFTLGKSVPKRNLEEAALQGQRLQPAFYVLLAREGVPKTRPRAELHYLAPNWPQKTGREFVFSFESWEAPWAEEMGDTLERLLKGIREGEFYILPDEGQYGHCSRCPYQVLCRKNHRPTRYRQTADPRTHSVGGLSKKEWRVKK